MTVAGFEIVTQLGSTTGSVLCRARHASTLEPALLKLPLWPSPAPSQLAALRREHELLRSLRVPGIARPVDLIENGDSPSASLTLVLEPFDGESLEAALGSAAFSWIEALHTARALAQILAGLHAAHLVHKDFRPANFLIDRERSAVCLVDASVAAVGAAEEGLTPEPQAWAYVAPEQTGRMNRAVDHRADLYALGISLYRMLTGRLPFDAHDALEWTHCHLARVPRPPVEQAAVPPVLSDITMKLLAKSADDRYQSAGGLLFDLDRCLASANIDRAAGPWVDTFELGTRDISDQLQISQKLYGRSAELATLRAAFERIRASGPTELVLISGPAGSGKTVLVQELQNSVVTARASFIAGKFDQHRRDVPYATLARAFSELVKQILSESEVRVAVWRERLAHALRGHAQLIVDLVPALELVIGKQPPVPEIEPREAQHRFRQVFRQFVSAFAGREHPLVIFVDDLQWADAASLELLKNITTESPIRHLLVIGGYRDDEVSAAHPLNLLLDTVRHEQAAVTHIELGLLAPDDLQAFIADTLHLPGDEVAPLARLVGERTGGNAFFAIQFLLELAEEGLLGFDRAKGMWRWKLEAIAVKGYTRNVVDLMVGKLGRLPSSVQLAMQNAACLGNSVEARLLAAAQGQPQADTENELAVAVRAGLLQRTDGSYSFSHDRVQEAAFSLIPEAERAALHLGMGRLMLAHLSPQAIEERIFDVVHALNLGAALIPCPVELATVRRLNTLAGHRAKAATAYAVAAKLFGQTLTLLPKNAWQEQYEETFALHVELAKCELLSSNFARVSALLEPCFAHARSRVDRARVYRLKMAGCVSAGRPDEAAAAALEALALFGLTFANEPDAIEAAARSARDEIAGMLQGRRILDLVDAPRTRDREIRALLSLLSDTLAPVYMSKPALYPLICSNIVKLSIQHGNAEASSSGYMGHANVLAAKFLDIEAACAFADLALMLDEKFGGTHAKARLLFVHASFVNHWREPFAACRRQLESAFASALELGNVFSPDYRTFDVMLAIEQGESLDTIIELSARHGGDMRFPHPTVHLDLLLDAQFARCLKGRTRGFDSMDDDSFREADWLADVAQAHVESSSFMRLVLRQMVAFIVGDHVSALQYADQAAALVDRMFGIPRVVSHHFFQLLALAALYSAADAARQELTRRTFLAKLPMFEAWAQHCAPNYLSRCALVKAEFARIEGRDTDAQRDYELAIQSARKNGSLHIEALACELAARFHAQRGLDTPADAYLRRARACYAEWGADGKVKQLDDLHPRLRYGDAAKPAALAPDMLAIVKASQAISSQIDLEELLDTLLRIALETAGAQRAVLLLSEPDGLSLAAEGSVQGQSIDVRTYRDAISVEEPRDLPLAILNYVRRSGEPVMLADAGLPHAFSGDVYLAQRQPKSVLCLPLLRRADLIGVLYLEHGLVSHAFTPGGIELLSMLASQAAISLETARLYASLQEREARFRTLVDANIIGIRIAHFDGRIVEANDAFLDLVGYSHADVAAGRLSTTVLTPPEYGWADERAREQLKATGSYAPFEKEYVRKDGSRVPVLAGGTFLEPTRQLTMGFVLDLTERRQAEAEREARRAADLANRAKSEFLANMSHELRTPLNAILGYAQLLRFDRGLSDRQCRGLDTIRQGGEHLLALIDDILDLARVEAGRLELFQSAVGLHAFLESVADIIRIKADEKRLGFHFEVAGDLPRTVRLDDKRLRQVLLNLLSNAVKFTDKGHVSLLVRALPHDGSEAEVHLRFEVHDSGVGMSEAELARLFQPFEQVGEVRRRQAGAGLGLAISRQLGRLMGGDIEVRSQPGQGTVFQFDIRVSAEAQAPAAPSARRGRVTGYEGPRKNVLVVDDAGQNREMLLDTLGALGFRLLSAEDGAECLEVARATRPDLVMMDMTMPVMDGCEATRRLRNIPALAGVPVIAMSASATLEAEARSREAGANAFIAKPIDHETLLDTIGVLMKLAWTCEESMA